MLSSLTYRNGTDKSYFLSANERELTQIKTNYYFYILLSS